LPDELLDFHEDLGKLDLSGKKAAIFGSFDWLYGDGGVAVDIVKEALRTQGAEIVQDELKVELIPTPEDKKKC
jgi:flavodoxin I